MSNVAEIYKFDELTWPEVNEAVAMGKIPIIPTGSVEQHGHHLPLKVDHLCANAVATEAARLKPELALVLPPVSYGYVHHVMDFSGSLNIHYEHFIQYVLDITKSLAYHGFKKMILVNGHGSNHNLVDMVARRTIVEDRRELHVFARGGICSGSIPTSTKSGRESVFPGGLLARLRVGDFRCCCISRRRAYARTRSRARLPRRTSSALSSCTPTYFHTGRWA